MAAIVAKTPGFGALKNRTQRNEFAKDVLAGYGEDITHKKYYGIIETAECLYWFGILPKEVNKLIDCCESTKDIAKELGVTELRVQRALDYAVPDNIEEILRDADKFLLKKY